MHSNGRVKLTFSIYETLLFLHYNVKILDIYKQNFNYFKICLKENFRFVKMSLRDEKFEPQINIDLYQLGVWLLVQMFIQNISILSSPSTMYYP